MIPQPEAAAVFHYAYRPLTPECKVFPADGGFSLTLFHDDRLVVILYNEPCLPRLQTIYAMPAELKMQCLQLIDGAAPWLSGLPAALCLPQGRAPRFISQFGFEGYPFLRCDDIPQMIRQPFASPDGRATRHLCVLYEDLAQLFLPQGLSLYLDGYTVDNSRLQPVDVRQFDPTWTNAAMMG